MFSSPPHQALRLGINNLPFQDPSFTMTPQHQRPFSGIIIVDTFTVELSILLEITLQYLKNHFLEKKLDKMQNICSFMKYGK